MKKYANEMGWSDIQPYEVTRFISEKTIEIRRMRVTPDDSWKPEFIAGGFAGHCINQESQTWQIESDETAPIFRIRLSKKYTRNEPCYCDKWGNRFFLSDKPRYYRDFNF